jgi:hypothetical protein
MVPGQGFIVVGNKTQKNTICIFIEKQNRTSDTRGETIRHNMQKTPAYLSNMSKIDLAPGGGVCYTCEA